jgi:hemoglobin-like flavoprotein
MAATLSTVTAFRRPTPATRSVRRRVFISYAHEDATWLKRFKDKLAPALSDRLNVWSDQDIAAGQDWHACIEKELASASAALLLVSDHFLNSSYISSVELPKMLERHQSGGLKIYWVPLTDELYEWSKLAPLQPAWPTDQPLKLLTPRKRNQAVKQICEKLVVEAGQLVLIRPGQLERLTADIEAQLPADFKVMLNHPIGGGNHSIVYDATMHGEPVVVKALVDSPIRGQVKHYSHALDRCKRLTHPCFARLHHALLDQEPQCLIMDVIEAPTLHCHLKGKAQRFSIDQVVHLVGELAAALQEYHDIGLLYGAMSANHVFYDAARAQLRLPAASISSYLSIGSAPGGYFPHDSRAATYLLPEQYHGQTYTQQSDQYSLALLAVEMLQGSPPVTVNCVADFERKRAFFQRPGEFIGAWKERHPCLTSILLRMLEARPERRFASLAEVAASLNRLEPEDVAIAKRSYNKCCEGKPEFYAAFYTRFFGRCPEARSMFGDIQSQYGKLHGALSYLLNFRDRLTVEPTVLGKVAERHRALRVTPEQFDSFTEALLETLRELSGEDAATIEAWRNTMRPGIAYLKQHAAAVLPVAQSA